MIAKHHFGRTGHLSSRVLLGAAAYWDMPQADVDASIELAISYGVNHFDVAASYGKAEVLLGNWIGRHGRPFFLATKTEGRTAAAAREDLHRSLERLKVDQVDLLQLHNLVDPGEWETAMGPGGALEAVIEARAQGLVRFIGVTGHGVTAPAMHYRALERFDFDSVLLPFSYVMMRNPEYCENVERLLDACRQRSVAVQTIKSLVHAPWGGHTPDRNTWYRPLEDQADIDRAVHWVLGHEGLFLNSVGDVHLLPRVLDAADRFAGPPSDEEMRAQIDALEMQPLFT